MLAKLTKTSKTPGQDPFASFVSFAIFVIDS